MSPESYYRHLVEVLLALSQQGDKIIIGRGANFVLKDALRVRLCASEHYRIQAIMARESLTEADASARIAHVEAERSRFVNSFYHRDVNDPSAYDLIVNVDRIGLEPAAASITAAMDAMCASAAAHEMPMRLGR
jgi:cytidylate kinase